MKKLKLLIILILSSIYFCGCSKNTDEVLPAIEPTDEPNYYSVALKEFMGNATGKVSVALFDLDGCGNDEMIVFDEGVAGSYEHWAVSAENGKIAVFDTKNGMNTSSFIIPQEYGFNAYKLYISSKNNLVLYDVFEGYSYVLYKYENGELLEEIKMADASYAGETYYSVNNVECDENFFVSKLEEYDVQNAVVTVSVGNMVNLEDEEIPAPINDAGKIL